jgi:hypothetical protein
LKESDYSTNGRNRHLSWKKGFFKQKYKPLSSSQSSNRHYPTKEHVINFSNHKINKKLVSRVSNKINLNTVSKKFLGIESNKNQNKLRFNKLSFEKLYKNTLDLEKNKTDKKNKFKSKNKYSLKNLSKRIFGINYTKETEKLNNNLKVFKKNNSSTLYLNKPIFYKNTIDNRIDIKKRKVKSKLPNNPRPFYLSKNNYEIGKNKINKKVKPSALNKKIVKNIYKNDHGLNHGFETKRVKPKEVNRKLLRIKNIKKRHLNTR